MTLDRYAVVGHPIGHSKSPRIHQLFAAQTGQAMSYSALLAPLDGFVATARQFFARSGRGLNVTVPFKAQAATFADALDDGAARVAAVNTLAVQDDGRIVGYNTDGVGLVRDLTANLGVTLSDRRVLVLGAGGAVRGILGPLCDAGVAELRILNRTPAKADAIVALFGHRAVACYTAKDAAPFDLIINGTSAGLSGAMPQVPAGAADTGTFCYDLVYGDGAAAFRRWAAGRAGAGFADGLGMLVEQAAESFYIWRGIRPGTRSVIDTLRSAQTNVASEEQP